MFININPHTCDITRPQIWRNGATTGVKKIYKGSSQGQGFFLGDTILDKLYLGDTLTLRQRL